MSPVCDRKVLLQVAYPRVSKQAYSTPSEQVSVMDPDLYIREAGEGGGGVAVSKKQFPPFGPQFGLKIRGDPGPSRPFPGSATAFYSRITLHFRIFHDTLCLQTPDGN